MNFVKNSLGKNMCPTNVGQMLSQSFLKKKNQIKTSTL